MSDYIPRNDTDRVAWMLRFATWLEAHGASHGISAIQISEFRTKADNSQTALDTHLTQQAAARGATANKNDVLGDAVSDARELAQFLQHDPAMTDQEREDAGLTTPDPTKTATSPETVAELDPPLLKLKFDIRHQVTVHFGVNPGNEHQNAKPHGVLGVEIQCAKGGIPTDESAWVSLGLDTDSPMLHHVTDTEPTTYAYRARYVDKKLNYGNFGDPAVCTVSV